jgi:hypothetical protein
LFFGHVNDFASLQQSYSLFGSWDQPNRLRDRLVVSCHSISRKDLLASCSRGSLSPEARRWLGPRCCVRDTEKTPWPPQLFELLTGLAEVEDRQASDLMDDIPRLAEDQQTNGVVARYTLTQVPSMIKGAKSFPVF